MNDHHANTPPPQPRGEARGFDLDALRLRQDFDGLAGTREDPHGVPVRRPHPQEWVQVHPSADWRFPAALLDVRHTGETFLVAPELTEPLTGEWKPKLLFSCVTTHGQFLLWPIKIRDEQGRLDPWNESAHRIATGHHGKWLRVQSNRTRGHYDSRIAEDGPVPRWPDEPFPELLARAFPPQRIIDSLDHPVVRALRSPGCL